MPKKVWEVLFTITEEVDHVDALYAEKAIEHGVVKTALAQLETVEPTLKTEIIRIKEAK